MLFNSFEFIFAFLPLTFFIYFALLNRRMVSAAKLFLVGASLFFYGWWNSAYLSLIIGSMAFNFFIGNLFDRDIKRYKKALLISGIGTNIALLGYFKYSDFFIENLNAIAHTSIAPLHLALPLAISFFTFQQISYLVDSYKGETKEYNLLNYALFVTFFPQLIAGPIVHHKEMMPQFSSVSNMVKRYKNIAFGLLAFSVGLFKKVVIADSFAEIATAGFSHPETLNILEAWATSLSYTFELYYDFSGYTDMAIGAALLFNIKLPINFNSPYKALNIQDFWRRWHMTLSRFLRDYIYIPLGGNRKGDMRLYLNLMATFIIGGIWHGAGWTFVLWGFLHGAALIVYQLYKRLDFKISNLLAWLITFNFINITWVFFRASDIEDALNILSSMFSVTTLMNQTHISLHIDWFVMAFIGVLYFKNLYQYRQNELLNRKTAYFTALLFVSALLMSNRVSEFLYYDF
jgi:D-alanyl-lipoteichoic acid acyltransferase DltB (MBOAT superfamily)